MNNQVNKTQYKAVASIINRILRQSDGGGLKPRVEVLERGTDGLVILLNDDAYDLAEYKGRVQDLFHTGETFVVEDDDFYLEPFDSNMTFKVAR